MTTSLDTEVAAAITEIMAEVGSPLDFTFRQSTEVVDLTTGLVAQARTTVSIVATPPFEASTGYGKVDSAITSGDTVVGIDATDVPAGVEVLPGSVFVVIGPCRYQCTKVMEIWSGANLAFYLFAIEH